MVTGCKKISIDAAFRDHEGNYVLMDPGEKLYWYANVSDMCIGRPLAGPIDLGIKFPSIASLKPEMMASAIGGYILFVFKCKYRAFNVIICKHILIEFLIADRPLRCNSQN